MDATSSGSESEAAPMSTDIPSNHKWERDALQYM